MQFKTVIVALMLAATATAMPRGLHEWGLLSGPWADASNWLDKLHVLLNIFGKGLHDAPHCDLSRVQVPTDGDMPGPDSGLSIHHVALGRGTQNYTCDTKNPSSVPVAAGAVATLFNVTCMTSMFPLLVEAAPSLAVHLSIDAMKDLNSWGLSVSGHHYFTDATTPFFDLNTSNGKYGVAPCSKNHATNAPLNAAAGLGGEAAVPWLKLTTLNGATEGIKNVFRTSTAGGSAPATCKGQKSSFQVQYSALYWYYSTR